MGKLNLIEGGKSSGGQVDVEEAVATLVSDTNNGVGDFMQLTQVFTELLNYADNREDRPSEKSMAELRRRRILGDDGCMTDEVIAALRRYQHATL